MNMSLQHGVSKQAEARPHATALVCDDVRFSYAQLEIASNRLANFLMEAGCGLGDRVALIMPKSTKAVIGMLGVLKSNAAYVPLDPSEAVTRLARMLSVADCKLILAAGSTAGRLQKALEIADLKQPPLIAWLDDDSTASGEHDNSALKLGDLSAFPADAPNTASNDDDLAQILFTSGSTGTPKGVMITHRNIATFLNWAVNYFDIGPDDRVSQHAPLRFDISTFDIFGGLWAGAEVHMVPAELNLLPHRLAAFIRDAELTQWFSVPSALNLMAKFDVVRESEMSSLRRVLFAGEVLPVPTLIHWMRRLPNARFTNLYGPTETTISSSYYTVPSCPGDVRANIPIGSPCVGERLFILNDKMRPVKANETGELYIAGCGVSPGYWRNSEENHAAFTELENDNGTTTRAYRTGDLARRDDAGLLHYCGRADMQIKSRGYRIELGEIESALHVLPELRESAVVAVQARGFDDWQICCAFVPTNGADASPVSLRKRLSEDLPAYMLPVRWKLYDTIPKNHSGKMDRRKLHDDFVNSLLPEPRCSASSAAPKRAMVRAHGGRDT